MINKNEDKILCPACGSSDIEMEMRSDRSVYYSLARDKDGVIWPDERKDDVEINAEQHYRCDYCGTKYKLNEDGKSFVETI